MIAIGLQGATLLFVTALLLIGISNLWSLRGMDGYPPASSQPRASLLIPARNEEANIAACVRSLLAQEYDDFEVLVLDDNSEDRTGAIVAELAATHPRLRLLHGLPLPPGWLGKHWACHQLAQAASGELLLFSDADTRHAANALANGVNALTATGADLLSALPHQEVITWGERLFVPFFPWTIFAFLQVWVALQILHAPAFAAAVGQYMLFRREAYFSIGGHAAVRKNAVDDIALARNIKARGLQLRLVDAGNDVTCRMYHNLREVFEGFSKNMFAAFGHGDSGMWHTPLYVMFWAWLGLVFWLPWIVLGAAALGTPWAGFSTGWAGIAVLMALLLWGLSHAKFRFPIPMALFYPVTLLLAEIIAVRSLILTARGETTWKGRNILRDELPSLQSDDK